MPNPNMGLLPDYISPKKYDITIEPDLNQFVFSGNISIDIQILKETDTIILNSSELNINSCQLSSKHGKVFIPKSISEEKKSESVFFKFENKIPIGDYILFISYTGTLNDKLRGFYRSQYKDSSGKTKHLATTQFEPTDARKAIPCWDEPKFKSNFKLRLIIPTHLQAISNMPILSTTPIGEKKIIEFAETPIMSTYLLAFIIGELSCIERMTPDGTLMRIWTTKDKESLGTFALDVSCNLLKYFNEYFSIPYPLPKLDHIAIPDFAAGAMENWGAITYRENALLVDPNKSSSMTKQNVASIISHEMAHMWFGDLVTMNWWNDLWLNESFASWMGDKAVDNLFPDWEVWNQFITYDTHEAFNLDGLENSHPIEQEVNNPGEIGQLFDAISYSKGASLLRMIESFIGTEIFRKGISSYLMKNSFGNATTKDLWIALSEASGKPISQIMDSWTNQTGYPWINANIELKPDEEINIEVKQQQFLFSNIVEEKTNMNQIWHIPLNIQTPLSSQETRTSFDKKHASITIEQNIKAIDPSHNWVKINPLQTGFFRVNYNDDNWESLSFAISQKLLPPADRVGLQNDAFALSKSGLIPITNFLDICLAYTNETNAIVWQDLCANLKSIGHLLSNTTNTKSLQKFIVSLLDSIKPTINWTPSSSDKHLDMILRTTVLNTLGDNGDSNTISKAKEIFKEYCTSGKIIDPNIKSTVYSLVAKAGDQEIFDKLWNLQKDSELEEERVRILRSMTCFTDKLLLQQLLEKSLSDEIRYHNTIGIVVGIGNNPSGEELAWEFLKNNWIEFNRRYGDGGFSLMRLVGTPANFKSVEHLKDVESFYNSNPTPSANRSINQTIENIKINIAWMNKNSQDIGEWLNNRVKS